MSVYLKGGTKYEDEKLLGNKNRGHFLKVINMCVCYFHLLGISINFPNIL